MKKKILIVPSWQLWPLQSGGAHAQTSFLKELASLHDVHVIVDESNTYDFEGLRNAFPDVVFHSNKVIGEVKLSILNRILTWFKKMLDKVSYRLSKYQSSAVQEELPSLDYEFRKLGQRLANWYNIDEKKSSFIKALDQKFRFDFIQYEMEYAIPAFNGYKSPHAQNVLILHEVMSLIITQYSQNVVAPFQAHGQILVEAARHAERKIISRFNKVVVFNELDRQLVEDACSDTSLLCSPYGLQKSGTIRPNAGYRNKIILVGSGYHSPNFIGVQWFLTSILPLVRVKYSDIEVFITGSWQKRFRDMFQGDSKIVFTGNLPENQLEQLMLESIFVSPVFIGSGLRTKIIEGLRMGAPMVVNLLEKQLLEGLAHNENVLLASDENSYATNILRLLDDAKLQECIGNAASILWSNLFASDKLLSLRSRLYQ